MKQEQDHLFDNSQWIAWISATVAAALTLTAFAFQTFETKDSAHERKEAIEKRLERIESKLDQIIIQRK